MTHFEAVQSALSQARQYYVWCIRNAREAEAIGDIATRDKELADADRKASDIRRYESILASYGARQLEAAE